MSIRSNRMEKKSTATRQIRICGKGGQGIVTAGKILGHAAFFDKQVVAISSVYSSRVRGGEALSDLIISNRFIEFPLVTEIDVLIAMSQIEYKKNINLLKSDADIATDKENVEIDENLPVFHYRIPAVETAREKFKSSIGANIILIAACSIIFDLVSYDSMKKAIEEITQRKYIEKNLQALKIGHEIGKTIK